MISRSHAERIARAYLISEEGSRYFGQQQGSRVKLAAMQRCSLGWSIVVRESTKGMMGYGEALHVIDRETGDILRFPPAMPPPMLLEDLARYRDRAVTIPAHAVPAPPSHREMRH